MPQFIGRSGSEEMQQGLGMLQQGMAALGQQFEAMRQERMKNWEDLFAADLLTTDSRSPKELAKKALADLQNGNPNTYQRMLQYFKVTKGMDDQSADIFIRGLGASGYTAEENDAILNAEMRRGLPDATKAPEKREYIATEAQTKKPGTSPKMQNVGYVPEAKSTLGAVGVSGTLEEPAVASGESVKKEGTSAKMSTEIKWIPTYMDNPQTIAFNVWKSLGSPENPSGQQMAAMIESWKNGLSNTDKMLYRQSGISLDGEANKIFMDGPKKWKNYKQGEGPDAKTLYERREVQVETQPASPEEILTPKTEVTVYEKPEAKTGEQPKNTEAPNVAAVSGVSSGASPLQASLTEGATGPAGIQTEKRGAMPSTPSSIAPASARAQAVRSEAAGAQAVAAQTLTSRDVKKAVMLTNEELKRKNEEFLQSRKPEDRRFYLAYQQSLKSDPRYIELAALSGDKSAQTVLAQKGDEYTKRVQIAAYEAQMKSLEAQLKKMDLDEEQQKRADAYNMAHLEYLKDKDAADRIADAAERDLKNKQLAFQNNQLSIAWAQLLGEKQIQGMSTEVKNQYEAETKQLYETYNNAKKELDAFIQKNSKVDPKTKNTYLEGSEEDMKNTANVANTWIQQMNQAAMQLNSVLPKYGVQEIVLHDLYTPSILKNGWKFLFFGPGNTYTVTPGQVAGSAAPAAQGDPSSEAAASGLMKK